MLEAARSRVSVTAQAEGGQEGDGGEDEVSDSNDRLFWLDKTGVRLVLVADAGEADAGAGWFAGGNDSDRANAAIELMVPLPPWFLPSLRSPPTASSAVPALAWRVVVVAVCGLLLVSQSPAATMLVVVVGVGVVVGPIILFLIEVGFALSGSGKTAIASDDQPCPAPGLSMLNMFVFKAPSPQHPASMFCSLLTMAWSTFSDADRRSTALLLPRGAVVVTGVETDVEVEVEAEVEADDAVLLLLVRRSVLPASSNDSADLCPCPGRA